MPEVGLRELKAHASQILRQVRDRRARYLVTYRGKPVAILSPITEADRADPDAAGGWGELLRLVDEASRRPPLVRSTLQEIFDDVRR